MTLFFGHQGCEGRRGKAVGSVARSKVISAVRTFQSERANCWVEAFDEGGCYEFLFLRNNPFRVSVYPA